MNIRDDIKTGKQELRSVSHLFGEALSQLSQLLQNEVDLAKAELSEKARKAGTGLGFVAGAVVLVIPALVMALLALSAALVSAGWSQPASYLTSAIVATVAAGVLFAIGLNRLDARELAPNAMLGQVKKDKDALKGMMR